jgi:hypothetical protein
MVAAPKHPKELVLQSTRPDFEAAIRQEFIEKSAIDPILFGAAIEFASDTETLPGGDCHEAIAEFLNWNLKQKQAGFSLRKSFFAALLHNENGSAWQAKLSFRTWNDEKQEYNKPYLAPTNNGSRAYLPVVPPEIREKIGQYCCVIVPTVGSFWDWLEAHPEIPIVITEGAKKCLASFSCGIVTIALYGHSAYAQTENGATHLIPDLARFCQHGREFTIAFDQDGKPQTRKAVSGSISKLSALLKIATQTPVKVATWSAETKGIDDLIVMRGRDEWLEVLKDAAPPIASVIKHPSSTPRLTPEEQKMEFAAYQERVKTEKERYDELFSDRPLFDWIAAAADHYDGGYDSSNNIYVAAAWAHLTYLCALMPATLKTYKLPNRYRDREDISINSIVVIAADRNAGKSTARGIVSKTFGDMALSQIQSEWMKDSIRAKKEAFKEAKDDGEERESSVYDSAVPRVEFGDSTFAALSKQMGVNEHYRREYHAPSFGGIVTMDEGADWLHTNGMLDIKNRNPGFSMLNAAWSGTIAGRSRISTGESGNSISNVNLNFLIPLQTDKYEALVAHPAFGSSGLNSRVICVPLRKLAALDQSAEITIEEVIAKLQKPKAKSFYPNQEIIRAIGNVRRRLEDQDNEVGWSHEAISMYLELRALFFPSESIDNDSEEATMRQRAYEDNLTKCAAMQAVSDAVYEPNASRSHTNKRNPFNNSPNEAAEESPVDAVIEIRADHVLRAAELCELSLNAQLYFWEKTAGDRERAQSQSAIAAHKIDWIELFNNPDELAAWVKSKREAGADTPRKVRDKLNGITRKTLTEAGINAQEAIKQVWD